MNIILQSLHRLAFLALCLVALPAFAALEAGNYQRFDSLAPVGSQPGRNLGRAVAVEGDLAVVGAPGEAVDGKALHGAAYVFTQANGRWRQRARLVLADGNVSMQFGQSVAISGGQILVGAQNASGGGQVYVFDGSGSSWSESQRFRPSGTSGFGYALAVQGDRLLVGAPEESGGGAAYVYERVGASWAFDDRLQAADRSSGDKFGRAVALHGNHAVVGAPYKGSLNTGAVYPFAFDGLDWSAGTPLNNIDTSAAYEGWALAMAADHLLVGVPGEGSQGQNSVGTVLHYQFGGGSWQLQERLDGPRLALASFGQALHFDGTRLFIGAPGIERAWGRRGQVFETALTPSGFSALLALPDPDMAEGIGRSLAAFPGGLLSGDPFSDVGGVAADGRVTVFRNDGAWRVDGVLDAPLIEATRRFGSVVSVSGNRAAVGMPWETVGANATQGAVQIFEFDGQRWAWAATVTDPFGKASDRFGSDVALDGDRLIVGAPNRENSGTSAGGSAVLFEFDGNAWNDVYRYDNAFSSNDFMGTAVALEGDRAAIGAPRYEAGVLSDSGLVVVLERVSGTWAPAAYLPGATANERLGSSLVISGGTLAAGAVNADAGAGQVRIYRKIIGSWSQLTSISAPAGSAGFGKALDLRDGLLAIGAPDGDGGSGRVAVYREGVTGFSAETLPVIPFAVFRAAGISVGIDGGRLVAGSYESGTTSAALFVFDRDAGGTWSYTGRIGSPDGAALFPDGFGNALSLRGRHLLAGAEWRARDEGRAFAYIEGRDNSLTVDSLSPNQPVSGQPISIAGSVGNIDGPASGQVRWLREDGAACSGTLNAGVGACALPGTLVGAHSVTGEFLPDNLPDLPTMSAAAGYDVVQADTSTSLSAMPAIVHPGQDIDLSATVSVIAPGSGTADGTLSFHAGDPDSTAALCSVPVGSGGCTVSAGSVGSADFQARYAGNTELAASDSAAVTVSITPWPASLSLTALAPLPAKVGQTLSGTVTISADAAAGTPTGRVRLLLDGQPGAWSALDGSGEASVSVVPQFQGLQAMWAEFDGQGGNFADASGGNQGVTVIGLSSSVALDAAPASGVKAGDTVTLTATVTLEDASAATGNVRIHPESAANPALCTVAAPSGSCDFVPPASGSYSFVAVYDGDSRALGDTGFDSVSAQPADTATSISFISPASPIVDQPYAVAVHVASGFGLPEGTVTVSDGEGSCQVALSNGSGSCELVAGYLGNRTVNAQYTPDDGVHAASDAVADSIEVQGIAVNLTLDVPAGPHVAGDSILLTPVISAADSGDTGDGILTLRLDNASGSVVCSGNPPLAPCPLTLPAAGVQGFHLAYSGTGRYASAENANYSIVVDPIQSRVDVFATNPPVLVTDSAFDLIVEVSSDNGVPPGTLDVADDGGLVCSGLTPDAGDGRYYCAMMAPAQAGNYALTLDFHSSSGNYADASTSASVAVSSAIRQISLQLDDGVSSVQAGDLLDYRLEVRNLASSGTVRDIDLDLPVIEGFHVLDWSCSEALGGADCPLSGPQTIPFAVRVDLPPASLIVFSIHAEVLTPAPPTVEAGVSATLPPGETNDDPDALYGVDVDIRADGLLFNDGFEGQSGP